MTLEIICDLPFGFPINNMISLTWGVCTKNKHLERSRISDSKTKIKFHSRTGSAKTPCLHLESKSYLLKEMFELFLTRMDTAKKILDCFGPVKTPAKHVLLVHINLSPRLNIHQGLKIGCICSTHQHLKMPNCEHWTLIAELAQHSALVIGKIHSSSLVDAMKPHARFQYSPVLKIDSIFKTHVR